MMATSATQDTPIGPFTTIVDADQRVPVGAVVVLARGDCEQVGSVWRHEGRGSALPQGAGQLGGDDQQHQGDAGQQDQDGGAPENAAGVHLTRARIPLTRCSSSRGLKGLIT